MAGNVWEWTDSWFDNDKDGKVLRGGSWLFTAQNCRCVARIFNSYFPYDRNYDIGFRCART